LHFLYYDKGVRMGRDKLWSASIQADPDDHPSRRQVQAWLFQQTVYQLDFPSRKTKTIRPFFSAKPYDSIQVDLQDYTNKPSGRYRYIFVAIDIFSRYVWAFSLTSKTTASTTRALVKLLAECREKPRLISHDQGAEFQGSFEALLKQEGIRNINGIAGRPESNGVVERVNSTLKRLLLRNKSYHGGGWADHIENALDIYNNLPHTTLGISPAQAIELQGEEQEELALRHKTLKRNNKADTITCLQIGDRVRLKVFKGTLDKYTQGNWSEQIYTIQKVIVPRRPFQSVSYKVNGKPQAYIYEDLLRIPDDYVNDD
jgi:transposase InsO family protein